MGYATNSGANVARSVLRDTLTRGEVTNGNYDIFSKGTIFTKANQADFTIPDCSLGSGTDYDLGFAMLRHRSLPPRSPPVAAQLEQ